MMGMPMMEDANLGLHQYELMPEVMLLDFLLLGPFPKLLQYPPPLPLHIQVEHCLVGCWMFPCWLTQLMVTLTKKVRLGGKKGLGGLGGLGEKKIQWK